MQLDDLSQEMTEEESELLGNAVLSYDLNLINVHSLHLKGTLCFVGMKVLLLLSCIRIL